jgi:hypothetical protein
MNNQAKDTAINIKGTRDFTFDGDRIADNWLETEWIRLSQIKGAKSKGYYTKIKVLHSSTGIYILFECGDRVLNASFHQDFKKLWKQDVVEVFIWPEEADPVYFEYELSPLNYELPILISDKQTDRAEWIPFLYEGSSRQTRHRVFIEGGKKKSNASINRWIAEIFIPYALLNPLNNVSPKLDMKWRANFYRIDYDNEDTKWWAWRPIRKNFHEYEKFGTIIF